jgi:hypothetical protein
MKSTSVTTDRGLVLSIADSAGKTSSAFFPTIPSGPLAASIALLKAATVDFAGVVNANGSRFQPDAELEHNRAAAANVTSKAFTGMQIAATTEIRAAATARALALAVDAETPATAPVRARVNLKWNAATVPQKATIAAEANYQQLAGLIASGALDDVPSEIRSIAEDRYALLRHVHSTGSLADHQRQASASDPIACGPDEKAALASADQKLQALKGRQDAIDDVRAAMRSLVDFTAVACGLLPDQAYNLLVGKPAT